MTQDRITDNQAVYRFGFPQPARYNQPWRAVPRHPEHGSQRYYACQGCGTNLNINELRTPEVQGRLARLCPDCVPLNIDIPQDAHLRQYT